MLIKNKKLLTAWCVFCLWLYAAWSVTELLIAPPMKEALDNDFLYTLLRDGVIKNLIWTLPALFLMRHFSDELAFPFKGIYRYRRQNSPYLLIAVLMTVAVVGGSILRHHGFSLSPSFKGSDLLIVLFVGISEETVFRGFLLNATLKYADTTFKKGLAAGINSILFLLIHFPVWITSGTFVSNFTSMSFLSVVLLSVLFSYCFIKCKNLAVVIFLHSFYDMLIFLFGA